MPAVYLLDASVFFFKAYFGYPDRFYTEQGQAYNGLAGYVKGLKRFIKREQPTHIVAAFDESLFSGFRHQICDEYKSNRVLPDDALAFQLEQAKYFTQALGIQTLASNEFEADDLLASCREVLWAIDPSLCVNVLTVDKDLGQLLKTHDDKQQALGLKNKLAAALSDDVLFDYQKDVLISPKVLHEKLGVMPHQVIDYLALVGDKVDAITGIAGVGAKTAAKLLALVDDGYELFENPALILNSDVRAKKSLFEKFSCDVNAALFAKNKRLTACDAGIDFIHQDFRYMDDFLIQPALQGEVAECLDNELVEALL